MRLTVQFKLLPTLEQQGILKGTTIEYIRTVNSTVADFIQMNEMLKYSSKNIVAELPGALRGQIAQDAKNIFKKYTKNLKENAKKKSEKQKEIKVPVLKKPVAIRKDSIPWQWSAKQIHKTQTSCNAEEVKQTQKAKSHQQAE